jgi:hypothetical protein
MGSHGVAPFRFLEGYTREPYLSLGIDIGLNHQDCFLLDRVGRFWKEGRTICSLRLSNEEGPPHEEDTG